VAITLLAEKPEYRLGHFGSVFISVWFSRLNIPALETLERYHRELAAKYGKVTFLSVVVGAAENPPAEVRARMQEGTKELLPLRRANLIVVQTRGLSAIIARSFLAAMSLMSSEKMGVFKTVEEAVAEAQRLPDQDADVKAHTTLAHEIKAFVDLPAPK
jgi:hypothetical protein